MKRIKFDGSGDRQVLVGLITDTAFNEAVREYITPEGLFHGNDPYNRIAKWCAKYYDRYDRAPGRHISGIFDRWASADDRSEEEVRDMARMIKYAESQTNGERFETDYLLGVAEERLNHHYEQRIADTLALGDAGQRAAVHLVHTRQLSYWAAKTTGMKTTPPAPVWKRYPTRCLGGATWPWTGSGVTRCTATPLWPCLAGKRRARRGG